MKKKHMIIAVAAVLIIGIVVAIALLSSANIGKAYLSDLKIVSPDGEHTLIVREWETIGGTGADIYYVSGLSEKLIGNTAADDCCYPFRDGDYSVVWKEDSVVLTYYAGRTTQSAEDPSTWEIDEFPLGK